jgi:cell division control protein 6
VSQKSGSLKSMFSDYIDKDSVFKNKDALTTNWEPENIIHRDKQINNLASILAPSLKGEDPSNVFIYGSVGTGKCVHPETLVLTRKGPKKIKEIFDQSSISKKVEKDNEEVLIPEKTIKVVAYNESMEQEIREVEALYRQKSPDQLVYLETNSGRGIESTENHSFLRMNENGSTAFVTAEELEEGDYIGLPGTNEVNSTVESKEGDFMSGLCRFAGYIIGDGGHYHESAKIRDDFQRLADELFGADVKHRVKENRTDRVVSHSQQIRSMLDELGMEVDVTAEAKQVPGFVHGLDLAHKANFVSALLDTDGYFSNKQSEVIYSSKSEKLIDQIMLLLMDFNIVACKSSKFVDGKEYYRAKISGADDFQKLIDAGVELKIDHKQERMEEFAGKESNSDVSLLPNVGNQIKEVRERAKLDAKEIEPNTSSKVHYYEKEEVAISKEKMSGYLEVVENRISRIERLTSEMNFRNARELRKLLKYEWRELAEDIDEKPANIRYAVKNDAARIDNFRQEFVDLVYEEAEEVLEDQVLEQKIDFLKRLTSENVCWDQIKEKQKNRSGTEYVYDLEVDENHNYVCGNGLISHNTCVTKHVTSDLQDVADEEDVNLNIVYINCKMKKVADTEYRLLAKLCNQLGEDVPSTGLPTDEVYNRFFEALKDQKGVVIIALDEIDALVKKVGDEFLYNLTRINDDLKETKVSILGISNDLNFTEYMDSRVKSSLSEEEIIFSPYNAIELREILQERTGKGFVEDALSDGVISKCSALAAQEHGDARRALDLIRVAGELAERSSSETVEKEHVNQAQEKIERDRVVETVRSQPKHSKLVLYTILDMAEEDDEVATGDVYSEYKTYCSEIDVSPLTQRRVSGLISELDMLGVINANVISKGRYGRTRQISVDLSESIRDQITELIEEKFYI